MRSLVSLLLALLLPSFVHAILNEERGRVIGGGTADLARFPYFATLNVEVPGGFFLCGAALIHDDVVLTAAHCSLDAIDYDVTVNSTTFSTYEPTEYLTGVNMVRRHPDFNKLQFTSSDIMIVRLDRTFPLLPKVRINENSQVPSVGEFLSVVGLGEVDDLAGEDPEFLQQTSVQAMDFPACNSASSYDGLLVEERMLCAGSPLGGKDACTGDGGGPLISMGAEASTDVQVGIVSFGFGCGRREYPGVYTRVSHYSEWIKEQVCDITMYPAPYCVNTESPTTTTAPSMSPAPTRGPGFGICFSGDSTITTKDRGDIAMRDLRIGDAVLTRNPSGAGDYQTPTFEKVYGFGHYHQSLAADFLRIDTNVENGKGSLEISANHMVFVGEQRRAMPASNLQKGDRLLLETGEWGTVRKIKTVYRKGTFAPFTPSGTIVVNGVVASTYVAFQDSEVLKLGSVDTFFTYQWLAHAFESPHRLYCMVASCHDETYTTAGVSHWVDMPLNFSNWLLRQHPSVMLMVLAPMVVLFGLAWVLEQALVGPFYGLAVFAVLVLLAPRKMWKPEK